MDHVYQVLLFDQIHNKVGKCKPSKSFVKYGLWREKKISCHFQRCSQYNYKLPFSLQITFCAQRTCLALEGVSAFILWKMLAINLRSHGWILWKSLILITLVLGWNTSTPWFWNSPSTCTLLWLFFYHFWKLKYSGSTDRKSRILQEIWACSFYIFNTAAQNQLLWPDRTILHWWWLVYMSPSYVWNWRVFIHTALGFKSSLVLERLKRTTSDSWNNLVTKYQLS